MTKDPHGTRQTYKRHRCRCTPCRAANAAYAARLRARRRKGQPILGTYAPASPTWRRLRSLSIEGFSRGELARRLGLRYPQLRFDTERVTVRTALRVARLHRVLMGESPDGGRSSLFLTNS